MNQRTPRANAFRHLNDAAAAIRLAHTECAYWRGLMLDMAREEIFRAQETRTFCQTRLP